MIKVNIKSELDVRKIRERIEKMNKGGLLKAGAHLRKSTRRAIRRGNQPAAAGSEPKSHGGGKMTLKNIKFAVDTGKDSVAVGYADEELDRIAYIHETGGSFRAKETMGFRLGMMRLIPIAGASGARNAIIKSKADAIGAFRFWNKNIRGKMLKYPRRPFLAKTLEKEKEKAMKMWRNAL